MKMLTLVARLPKYGNKELLRKVWIVASYLKDEVGVKVNLIVKDWEGEPQIIVMNDVISLKSDISEILDRVASKLSYDIADIKFLDKIAAATLNHD